MAEGAEGENLHVDSQWSMDPIAGLDLTIHEIMTTAKTNSQMLNHWVGQTEKKEN